MARCVFGRITIEPRDRVDAERTDEYRGKRPRVTRERDALPSDTRPAGTDSQAADAARDAAALLQEMESTLSWRITRPLRSVRRMHVRWKGRLRSTPPATASVAGSGPGSAEEAFGRRLDRVRTVVGGGQPPEDAQSLAGSLRAYERALQRSVLPAGTNAWLSLAAVVGSYPGEAEVDAAARLLRTRGAGALVNELGRRFGDLVESDAATTAGLEVLEDVVVVDPSHTISTDLHTGIQRVVRETLSRWVTAEDLRLVCWNEERGCLMRLAPEEYQRLRRWREELHESGAPEATRSPRYANGDMMIPFGCTVVVPEVPDPGHARALASLVSAQVVNSLSIIGYDLIPVVAAETTAPGVAGAFCEYLSLVRSARRLSAISDGTALSFRAFGQMLAAEGRSGPAVRTHPLPTESVCVTDEEVEDARVALSLTGKPLVLAVGSHEPRKNQMAVLEASERLWAEGQEFELLMPGGSHWRNREFVRYAERLHAEGCPINVRSRVTDTELWAAYQVARFTVYPSLVEGFGLPVAESLASGTPVITSSYGSMAEIGSGGGALLVDPRDVDDIVTQMRRLLTDDELVERLRREARRRDLGSWDEYAHDVWVFLTQS